MRQERRSRVQSLCVALLAVAFRADCAAGGSLDVLFESLPNFSDEVLDPKFQVAISKRGVQQNETEQLTGLQSVTLRALGGSEYTCYHPQAQEIRQVTEQDERGTEKLPSGRLKALTNGCFYRLEDWWSYEVCYHKQIRQYHRQGDQTTSEFILGVFSGNMSEADEIMHEEGAALGAKAYVRESHTGGTECDVADRRRSTELRYICARDEKTAIVSVKELHSCAYQIVLATPLICAHPAFKGKEVPIQDIRCFPAKRPTEPGSTDPSGTADEESIALDEDPEVVFEESDVGGGDHVVTLHMDDLDEASLDELVKSLINLGVGEDPDQDFLEAGDEEADDQGSDSKQHGAQDEL